MRGQHGLAGAHHGTRRQGSQLCGQDIDRCIKRVIGHTFPDQAPFSRLGSGQLLRRQRQAHGTRQPQALRHGPGRTGVRNQADLGKRQHERRSLRRHDHVARQCQAATRSSGHTLHTRKGGHTQVGQPHDEGFEVALHHVADVGRGFTRGEHHVRIGQVLPGAETSPCPGDHQHPDLAKVARAGLQRIERIPQLGVHVTGEGVHFVWPVQRETRHTTGHLKFNVFVRHFACLHSFVCYA